MTTTVLKQLPDILYVVRVTYTLTRTTGVNVQESYFGPFQKESTANAVVTNKQNLARGYGRQRHDVDTLDPGEMVITVDKLKTPTNWVKSDI